MLIKKHKYQINNTFCQCFGNCDCFKNPPTFDYFYTAPYTWKHYRSRKAARMAIKHKYQPNKEPVFI